MIKNILTLTFLFSTVFCFSQESKDTLFFDYDSDYLTYIKNYENQHSIKFKTEELVSSAYGKVQEDSFFYFSEVNTYSILKNTSTDKLASLRNYLHTYSDIFLNKTSNKLDSYKIMRELDKYVVYFKHKDKYLTQMKVVISLQE